MLPAAADDQQDRAAFGIAFAKHRPEAARSLRPAEQGTDLDMRGETLGAQMSVAAARSGRVALIRPQKHGGERVAAARTAHFVERRSVSGHTAYRRKGF